MGKKNWNVNCYGSYDLINRFDLWEILNDMECELFDKRTLGEIRKRVDGLGNVIDMMREAKDYTRICPVCYTELSHSHFLSIIGEPEEKLTTITVTDKEKKAIMDILQTGLDLFCDSEWRKEHGLDE